MSKKAAFKAKNIKELYAIELEERGNPEGAAEVRAATRFTDALINRTWREAVGETFEEPFPEFAEAAIEYAEAAAETLAEIEEAEAAKGALAKALTKAVAVEDPEAAIADSAALVEATEGGGKSKWIIGVKAVDKVTEAEAAEALAVALVAEAAALEDVGAFVGDANVAAAALAEDTAALEAAVEALVEALVEKRAKKLLKEYDLEEVEHKELKTQIKGMK